MRSTLPLLAVILPGTLPAASQPMEILVDGAARTRYVARGVTYIEAVKGREYEIRLTNPYPVRAAVALSVDGLNTLDARHTDARSGRKWVLDPYQTITLRGWQTSSQEARRFFFTSEERSYGQWLGKTENLGVISAAFFRERVPEPARESRFMKNAPESQAGPQARAQGLAPSQAKDELAATGIGRAEEHQVTMVRLDLEDRPAAVVTMRYEYRAALIALGVIPPPMPVNDALHRREKARGFVDSGYCPSPK